MYKVWKHLGSSEIFVRELSFPAGGDKRSLESVCSTLVGSQSCPHAILSKGSSRCSEEAQGADLSPCPGWKKRLWFSNGSIYPNYRTCYLAPGTEGDQSFHSTLRAQCAWRRKSFPSSEKVMDVRTDDS